MSNNFSLFDDQNLKFNVECFPHEKEWNESTERNNYGEIIGIEQTNESQEYVSLYLWKTEHFPKEFVFNSINYISLIDNKIHHTICLNILRRSRNFKIY